MAAWLLVVVYLYLSYYYPQAALGLYMLPLVLVLVAAAALADRAPFAPDRRSRAWGAVHGVFLLLGTVAVMVGFVAGLMYLVQSRRLKHKLPPSKAFDCPASNGWRRSTAARSSSRRCWSASAFWPASF